MSTALSCNIVNCICFDSVQYVSIHPRSKTLLVLEYDYFTITKHNYIWFYSVQYVSLQPRRKNIVDIRR